VQHGSLRAIAEIVSPARTVAMDCAVPDATSWELAEKDMNEALRDEIAVRVDALIREIGGG